MSAPDLTRENARLRVAISDALEELENLPSGIDTEADPEDQSPADATAHTGGLVWRILTDALEGGGR